ncbi:hypothetical protein ABBQ32_14183 [Trebouxia sp. C0010 RCD-2024]
MDPGLCVRVVGRAVQTALCLSLLLPELPRAAIYLELPQSVPPTSQQQLLLQHQVTVEQQAICKMRSASACIQASCVLKPSLEGRASCGLDLHVVSWDSETLDV